MHQLRYFTAVARTGNFTRAAEQCHIAQPSLSQQIRKLEDELDEKLILRLPGGKSRLTPAGEILLTRANRILAETQSIVEELRDRQKVISGAVRLGAIPTIAPYLIPDALLAFHREHPQVELVVHEATTEQLLQQLEKNELDFVIVSPPLLGGPWTTHSLGVEPLYLVTPKGRKFKRGGPLLEDLREEEFILMRDGHCLSGQVTRFCKLADFRPRVHFLSAQVETLKSLIRAGAGVSLLPAMALANLPAETSDLQVVSMRAPVPSREIVFASLPDFPLPLAAREFQEHLVKVFNQRQAWKPVVKSTKKSTEKKPV